MEFNDYQEKVLKFRMESGDPIYAMIGLSGEVGELHSLVAKAIRDGIKDEADFEINVKKELGDILWFIAAIADDFETSLDEIANINYYKLKDRFNRNAVGGSGDAR
jgi:NTP pyrophosphatase (non-canonical NTP hydrolase)